MNAQAARKTATKPAAAPRAKSAKPAKPARKSAAPMPPNAERLMTVLLAPVVSEKGTQVGDKHAQVIFRVAHGATKPEVRAAVELLFKVDVESVQISNVHGKIKRFGAHRGRRPNWKKAYVSLKEGQEINFAQEA
jgi:large subunit ribosomal protein L23